MAGKVIDATLRFVDDFTKPYMAAMTSVTKSTRTMQRAGREIQKAGKKISSVGSTLSKGITLPIVGIATASIKLAADFEQSMSKVKAISGATGDDLVKLREKALEMGERTKYSAQDSADAFAYMAQAGWKSNQMLKGIEGVMFLASASGEDLASVSNIVTNAISAFGLKARDAGHFADVMATAAANSNTNVGMLGESFTNVAPLAGAMGYSIEDTSVALGLMANNGIVAGEAGTSLRSILKRMASPTTDSAESMKNLGIEMVNADGSMKSLNTMMRDLRRGFSGLSETEKIHHATMIAGTTGITGMLAIVNASEESFNALRESVYKSDGAAQDMAKTMQDNLWGRLEEVKSQLETIGITIGDKVIPYIEKGVAHIGTLTEKFSNLSDEQMDAVIKWGAIIAVLPVAITIFGKIVTVVGFLITIFAKVKQVVTIGGGAMALLATPVGIAIAVILGVIAVVILLIKHFDKVKEGVKMVLLTIHGAITELGNFILWLVGIVTSVANWIGEAFLGVIGKFGEFMGWIGGVFGAWWDKTWTGLVNGLGAIFGGIVGFITSPIQTVIGLINKAISGLNKVSVTIPSWVPAIGGETYGFNIPSIPMLYKGTENWQGGAAMIHDKGAEIVDLPRGSRVYPHDKSLQMAKNEGARSGGKSVSVNVAKLADKIIIQSDDDINSFADKFVRRIEEVSNNSDMGVFA